MSFSSSLLWMSCCWSCHWSAQDSPHLFFSFQHEFVCKLKREKKIFSLFGCDLFLFKLLFFQFRDRLLRTSFLLFFLFKKFSKTFSFFFKSQKGKRETENRRFPEILGESYLIFLLSKMCYSFLSFSFFFFLFRLFVRLFFFSFFPEKWRKERKGKEKNKRE